MNYVRRNEIHRSFTIFAALFPPALFSSLLSLLSFLPSLLPPYLPMLLSVSPWGKFMAICFMQQSTNGQTGGAKGIVFKNGWKRDGQTCTNKQVWLIHRFRLSRVGLGWSGDAGRMSWNKLVWVGVRGVVLCGVRGFVALLFPHCQSAQKSAGRPGCKATDSSTTHLI